MKVTKGIYRSGTCGDCDAVSIEINGSHLLVVNLSGVIYHLNSPADFIAKAELIEKQDSKVFPKLTDFFPTNLKNLEINISFKD